jgi:hypothetical protein
MATIEFHDNGILLLRLKDNTEFQLEDSIELYKVLLSKFDGKNKFRLLVDPGGYTSITKEAREFSGNPEKNIMTAATAVIVKSLAHRLVINFIVKLLQEQNMKIKMFETKEKAIEWLLSVKA